MCRPLRGLDGDGGLPPLLRIRRSGEGGTADGMTAYDSGALTPLTPLSFAYGAQEEGGTADGMTAYDSGR